MGGLLVLRRRSVEKLVVEVDSEKSQKIRQAMSRPAISPTLERRELQEL